MPATLYPLEQYSDDLISDAGSFFYAGQKNSMEIWTFTKINTSVAESQKSS